MKAKDARTILEWLIEDNAKDMLDVVTALVECLQREGVSEDLKDAVDDLWALANSVENDFYRWRQLPAKEAEK